MVLAHSSSQNASVVGSYISVHQMYTPTVLATKLPVMMASTPAYRATKLSVLLGVTLMYDGIYPV